MLGQLYSSVRQRPVAAWQCGQSGFDKGIRRCLNPAGHGKRPDTDHAEKVQPYGQA